MLDTDVLGFRIPPVRGLLVSGLNVQQKQQSYLSSDKLTLARLDFISGLRIRKRTTESD